LLLNNLSFLDESTNAEIAEFYRAFIVHQNVIKLDISVKNTATVAMSKAEHYLLENILSFLFFKSLLLFYIL